MELVLLCLSLLVQHGFTQESCKCLDRSLCGAPAGCGYKCQAGFAGETCNQTNFGFNNSENETAIFDGNYETCWNYRGRKPFWITFLQPIDIDKIRIHRKKNGTGSFYAYVFKGKTSLSIWDKKQGYYKKTIEGAAVAVSFPLKTGVTALKINNMNNACEVELTNVHNLAPSRETPSPATTLVCKSDICSHHGSCTIVGKIAVCQCHHGYTGNNCEIEIVATQKPPTTAPSCEPNSCNNGGTCRISYGRQVCTCQDGYRGDSCESACSPGHYGSRCARTCPTNCKDRECNHVDGSCVCIPGWNGTRCSQPCKSGSYGQNCSSPCSPGCTNNWCYAKTGVCVQCRAGWKSLDNQYRCDRKICSPGCATECGQFDGRCDTCNPGWTHRDASKLLCDQECSQGRYGLGCSSSCSQGCLYNECNKATGVCQQETCAAGWTNSDNNLRRCDILCSKGSYGRGCTGRCPTNCKEGECNHVDGSCECKPGWEGNTCGTGCSQGRYGQNCSSSCSKGCNYNNCNKTTGQCQCKPGWTPGDIQRCEEKCSAGWYGSNCGERCNEGCQTEHCNHVTGDCNSRCEDGWTGRTCQDKCRPGRYGPQCRNQCRPQCVSCHHVSGSCGHNCTIGWFGRNCDQNCTLGTYGEGCKLNCSKGCDPAGCDSVTGNCSGRCIEGRTGHNCVEQCPPGHYGRNCISRCSKGCVGRVCNRSTGECTNCADGWKHGDKSSRCDHKCENGTFGAGCGETCSSNCNNVTCHHVHGACLLGCQQGWSGDSCQEPTAQSSLTYVAVGLVLLLLLLLLIVLLIVFRKKIRRPRPADKANSRSLGLPLVWRQPAAGVEDEEGVENEYANQPEKVSSTSVPLTGLRADVASKREVKETLQNEYVKLPQGLVAAHDISLTEENNPKNRFRGIYPYNHSLVPLNTAQGRPTYINASFIDGLTRDKQYIATQGPLPDTLADLWEMIWQYNIPVIVMLANVLEDGKRRCEPYWPTETDPTVKTFGHINVSVADECCYADFTVRTLHFTKGLHSRTIKHVHYTVWPDKGVPADTLSLVALRQKVRSLCDFNAGPLVVHCSAGVGRTGTLIALDYLMEEAETKNRVDIFGCVWTLRGFRVKMVQTDIQYVFLHDCILDAVEYTQTPTHVKLFVSEYKRLNRESGTELSPNLALNFKKLQETPVPATTNRAAKDHNNRNKNRNLAILPGDLNRPYLIKPVPGRNDYINAVVTSSYRRRNGLLLTQSPLPSTVVDFWRLIRDHHVERVVLLDNYTESDKDCGVFWPGKQQRCQFGPFTVSKGKTEEHNGFSMETLDYKDSSPDEPANEESVTLFRCTFWPQNNSLPESDSRLLSFLDFIRQWDSAHAPLVVVCRDGCTRSGLYCVLSNVLERLIVEKEVAINNAIRRLRLVRRQVVASMEQYQFIHEAVSSYILDFHDYSNV